MTFLSRNSYPSFGSPLPTRCWTDPNLKYKYGFNGKEKDDETSSVCVVYDYGFRIYDSRLGRFLSVDPISSCFPWNTSFAYAENNPIAFIDLEGLERYFAADGTYLGQIGISNEIRVVDTKEIFEKNKHLAPKCGLGPDGLYVLSTKLSERSNDIMSKIFTTIYFREIKGTDSKIEVYEGTPDDGAKCPNGEIAVNKNVQYSLINNYWDLVSLLFHEEGHRRKGLAGDADFGVDFYEHESITYSVMKNKLLWGKMSANGRKFHLKVYNSQYVQPLLEQIREKASNFNSKEELEKSGEYRSLLSQFNKIRNKYIAAGGDGSDSVWDPVKFFKQKGEVEPINPAQPAKD